MEATLEKEKKNNNLTQWLDDPPGSSRRLRLLAEAATDFFDKPMEELRSKVRTNDLVWPRACCMWIARDAGYTLKFIADWWDKNHATIHNAVKLVNDLREMKPAYDKQFRRFAVFSKNYIQRKDNY
jgi:chromosomal replication initiation ATPase DnaA